MKGNRKNGLIILLVIVFLILVVSVLLNNGKIKEDYFPKKIALLRLIEKKELHADSEQSIIPFSSISKKYNLTVGKYIGSGGLSTIYRLQFNSNDDASEELNKLIKKIEQKDIPFTHLKEIEYSKKTIYLFLGYGKAHYLFLIAENIFWVEADIPIAQVTVSKYIEFLNTL